MLQKQTKKRLTRKPILDSIESMKTPQIFVDAKGSPKVIIVMSGNKIQDIVKQGSPNLEIEIINYDIDPKIESDYLEDKEGKPYIQYKLK